MNNRYKMWTKKEAIIEEDRIVKYMILLEQKELTFKEVIINWQESRMFRVYFSQILKESNFEGFFWEVKPISIKKLDEKFEFVLVKSNTLPKIKINPKPFQKQFTKDKSIINFKNLGGDAELIIPCPDLSDIREYYSHIGKFVREGNENQIEELWKKVGEVYEKQLEFDTPKWLSTSGLGVSWLHIRIDGKPKYYTYKPYRSY